LVHKKALKNTTKVAYVKTKTGAKLACLILVKVKPV